MSEPDAPEVPIEEDVAFGIVLRDEDGARPIGCTAEVTEVTERYEDGRLDIVVTGAEPFRVLDRFDAEHWPAGKIELLTADSPGPDLAEELGAARAAFAELLEAVGANAERAGEAANAYAIAAQIEMPAAEKQALLEADDERDRLLSLEGSLRRLLGGLNRRRELGERAKTNGHAPGRIGPIQRPEE
jgi:Lon protease-like protein